MNNLPITRNYLPITATVATPTQTPRELTLTPDLATADSWSPVLHRPAWAPEGPSGGSAARDAFVAATDTLTGDLYTELRNTGGQVEGSFIPAFDELARIRHRIRQGEAVPRQELEDAIAAARSGLQEAMANHDSDAFHAAAQRAIGTLDGLSFEDGDTALTALLDGSTSALSEALEGGGLVSDLVNTATNETPDLLQNAMYDLLTRLESGDVSLSQLRRELNAFRRDLAPLAAGGSDAASALLSFLNELRPLERAAAIEQFQNGAPIAAHQLIPRDRISG